MTRVYLEITYRNGKPQAAYLYLPRQPKDASARTLVTKAGLVVDFASDGRAIGVEIPSLSTGTREAVLDALAQAGHPPVKDGDLAPLRAA